MQKYRKNHTICNSIFSWGIFQEIQKCKFLQFKISKNKDKKLAKIIFFHKKFTNFFYVFQKKIYRKNLQIFPRKYSTNLIILQIDVYFMTVIKKII